MALVSPLSLQDQLLQEAFGPLCPSFDEDPAAPLSSRQSQFQAERILATGPRSAHAFEDLAIRGYSMRSELARLDQLAPLAGHSPRGW